MPPYRTPGDLAREYAKRMGWTLRRRNVMVEGDSDVRYLELASKLYSGANKLELLGADLSLFACGSGDYGGTNGMIEQLPPLLNIIRTDPDQNGKVLFRVLALVDNDRRGRELHRSIIQQYRQIKANRDIFLLQHVFPRTASEPNALTSQIAKHNTEWNDIDCEIEDLLGSDLIELFLDANPNALKKDPARRQNRCHYEWTGHGKGMLGQFTKSYASLSDTLHLVELLKSLRFYLGLPPDGV